MNKNATIVILKTRSATVETGRLEKIIERCQREISFAEAKRKNQGRARTSFGESKQSEIVFASEESRETLKLPIPITMASPRSGFRSISWATQFLAYKRPSWKCASCKDERRPAIVARRRFATSAGAPAQQSRKPYYVTTPIFYVNAGKVWRPFLR